MIILVTGIPGSGKTAKVVDLLAHDPQFQGRPLFSMGVPELKLEHQAVPPVSEWVEFRPSPEDESLNLPYFTFPANSVIVLDEAQRIYRPRPNGSKVPPEVQAFETHRHTGVDFILITQHPNLLDANIRKLIGRHFHVHVTSLGRQLLDWPRCGDVESKAEREVASRSSYKPPKRVFDLYKSADAHTVIKRKLPWYFWVMTAGIVGAVALGAVAYKRITAKTEPSNATGPTAPSGGPAALDGPRQASSETPKAQKLTAAEYHANAVPRVPGLWHTAPKYDEVTTPNSAPFPVGCLQRGDECRCIDQQGHRYATTHQQCIDIVKNGIFREFELVKDRSEKPKATS